MTDKRSEIKQREAAATKGPWRYESYVSGTRCVSIPDRRALYEYRNQKCECHPAEAMHWVNAPHDDQEVLNLRFIAHAREDIPYLLAELDRIEAQRDRYKEAAETLRETVADTKRESNEDFPDLGDLRFTATSALKETAWMEEAK